MKTAALFKAATAVAAAAFVIYSCSIDEVEYPVQEDACPAIFNLDSPDTKALLGSDVKGHFGKWETGDRMGTLVTSNSGSVTVGTSNITPGSPSTVAVYNGYKKFSGGERVRAFYPYNAKTQTVSGAYLEIPVEQQQSGTDFDFDAMPMVSGEYVIPSALDSQTYPVGDMVMANLASMAEFRIFTSNSKFSGDVITSVEFSANASLAGGFNMDLSKVDPYDPATLAISGYVQTSVRTTVSGAISLQSSLENAFPVYMVVAPGTYGGSVVVTTNKAVYRFQLKSSLTFRRSVIRSLGVDLGSCTDITPVSYEGAVTVSKTVKTILSEMGHSTSSNGTVVNPLFVDDVITVSTTGTGNSGKIYGTASEWRLYTAGGGNVIITAASGYELRSVKLTHSKTANNAAAYVFAGPASNVLQPVSGSSVTFGMTSGNMRLTAIEVVYVPHATSARVRTGGAAGITSTSATLNAEYSGVDLSRLPQAKGFYWGTEQAALTNELYDDNLVNASDGSYATVLYNLSPGTTYYYQAFMTVWAGSEYKTVTGEVMTFTTDASSAYTGRGYLDCVEVPDVTVSAANTGVDPISGTLWYQFDLTTPTRKLVTHSYSYGGKVYRNYTSCVDQTKRCPIWVAYPMHNGAYPNNNSGRGSWDLAGYDPAIPVSWQSSGSTSDYNNGNGYARGHMCASEDRQVNDAANTQTFYYTNQAPQWQNSFNAGVWSTLEGKIQAKAKQLNSRDTLYVVSGTLFEDGKSGPSNDGGTVGRPSHFYKLLMLCSYDASGTVTDAKGAAFIYTNEAQSGSYDSNSFRSTIDAIEQRAGFDFFPLVPAELQTAAESSFSNIL